MLTYSASMHIIHISIGESVPSPDYVLVWYIAILLMLHSYLFLDLYCMATPTRTAIDEVCRKTKRLPAAVENCQGSVV